MQGHSVPRHQHAMVREPVRPPVLGGANMGPEHYFPHATFAYHPLWLQYGAIQHTVAPVDIAASQPVAHFQRQQPFPSQISSKMSTSASGNSHLNTFDPRHAQPHTLAFSQQFSTPIGPSSAVLHSPALNSQSSNNLPPNRHFSIHSITNPSPASPTNPPISPVSTSSSSETAAAALPSIPDLKLPFHSGHTATEFTLSTQSDVSQLTVTHVSSPNPELEAAAFLSGLSGVILSRDDTVSFHHPHPAQLQQHTVPSKPSRMEAFHPLLHSSSGSTSRESDDNSPRGKRSPPRGGLKPRENHCCPNCGVSDSTLWRNCTIRGKVHYLCNACGLRFKKGKYCALCYKVYYDADTSSFEWRQCNTCCNWTHKACLGRHPRYSKFQDDHLPYTCGICTHDPHLDDEMIH